MISRHQYILIYCWIWLAFHLVRIVDRLCLSCLAQPFLFEPRQDPTVWLMQYLEIPSLIANNYWLSVAFDIGLPILIVVILLKYKQNITWLWLGFIFCFWVYLLTIFSFPSLSIRKYLGLAVVPLVFVLPHKYYIQGLTYLRFFCLFIFSSSAMWKISSFELCSSCTCTVKFCDWIFHTSL